MATEQTRLPDRGEQRDPHVAKMLERATVVENHDHHVRIVLAAAPPDTPVRKLGLLLKVYREEMLGVGDDD